MSDMNVRSESVDVEQIMKQIRARVREKRGADYTEAEIQQLANVKLERFLDPKGVRSDLIQQYRRGRVPRPAPPGYRFEDTTLYETHRGLIRALRRLLRPVLKLFFNPDKITSALHTQTVVNEQLEGRIRWLEDREPLSYELLHNLTFELTRLGIEVHNLRMRVESLSSRLEFDERRARSLESVVQYRPGALQRPRPDAGSSPATTDAREAVGNGDGRTAEGTGRPAASPANESGERRRRRRRRRRRPGQTLADSPGANSAAGDRDADGGSLTDDGRHADEADGPDTDDQ
jgi:hypothetical protein